MEAANGCIFFCDPCGRECTFFAGCFGCDDEDDFFQSKKERTLAHSRVFKSGRIVHSPNITAMNTGMGRVFVGWTLVSEKSLCGAPAKKCTLQLFYSQYFRASQSQSGNNSNEINILTK